MIINDETYKSALKELQKKGFPVITDNTRYEFLYRATKTDFRSMSIEELAKFLTDFIDGRYINVYSNNAFKIASEVYRQKMEIKNRIDLANFGEIANLLRLFSSLKNMHDFEIKDIKIGDKSYNIETNNGEIISIICSDGRELRLEVTRSKEEVDEPLGWGGLIGWGPRLSERNDISIEFMVPSKGINLHFCCAVGNECVCKIEKITAEYLVNKLKPKFHDTKKGSLNSIDLTWKLVPSELDLSDGDSIGYQEYRLTKDGERILSAFSEIVPSLEVCLAYDKNAEIEKVEEVLDKPKFKKVANEIKKNYVSWIESTAKKYETVMEDYKTVIPAVKDLLEVNKILSESSKDAFFTKEELTFLTDVIKKRIEKDTMKTSNGRARTLRDNKKGHK